MLGVAQPGSEILGESLGAVLGMLVQPKATLRAAQLRFLVEQRLILLARRIFRIGCACQYLAKQGQREIHNEAQRAIRDFRFEFVRIVVIRGAQIDPSELSQWATENANEISGIGIAVITRRCFRPAIPAAGKRAVDDITAWGVR